MVKRADCGFLAMRHRETRALHDADHSIRRDGRIPGFLLEGGQETGWPMFEETPLCFQMVITFDRARCSDKAGRLSAIQEERECSEFTEWRVGFTPKEHREMLDRQRMIEREDQRDREMREYELKRDQAIRDREDKRDVLATERHKEQMKTIRGQHWRELLVFGGLIAVATLAAGFLEGSISRGWWLF